MPVAVSYPGVYVQEVSSGVRTITGVATSIAAFVGYTAKGREHVAQRVFGFSDFERHFGGLASDSELSYAVHHFFENGGTQAYVVRVPGRGAVRASLRLQDAATGGNDTLKVIALSSGTWGKRLVAEVDYDGVAFDDEQTFNLTVRDLTSDAPEVFRGVSMSPTSSRFVLAVVNDEDSGSKLIRVEAIPEPAGAQPPPPAKRPARTGTVGAALALDADLKPTGIDTKKPMAVKVWVDLPAPPAIAGRSVVIFKEKEAVPTSVAGLCRVVERALNAELQGVSVSCTPVQLAENSHAIRVVAYVPGSPDVVISFAAGDVDPKTEDADRVLRLSAGTVNVAHYSLGTARGPGGPGIGEAEPGTDGAGLPHDAELIGDRAKFSGLFALDKVDLFNILCIPDATRARRPNASEADDGLNANAIFGAASTYCERRRAFLVIDPPPGVDDVDKASDWKSTDLKVRTKNAAAYFPRLKLPDPLNSYQLRAFAPCGVVAGLYARIDAARGVWKAPAGVDATLTGVQGLTYKMSDAENGVLNQLGLNCFRVLPVYGAVAWGARTLVGADAAANEWKYLPVRRFALFLEESLFRGSSWVVFEPNDEPLWAQIRLNIGAFMQTLFRQGAFQGKTPRDAYFVKCDSETTTQDDINRGVVNIVVGFAPLKPAEFVVLSFQQMAGKIQT